MATFTFPWIYGKKSPTLTLFIISLISMTRRVSALSTSDTPVVSSGGSYVTILQKNMLLEESSVYAYPLYNTGGSNVYILVCNSFPLGQNSMDYLSITKGMLLMTNTKQVDTTFSLINYNYGIQCPSKPWKSWETSQISQWNTQVTDWVDGNHPIVFLHVSHPVSGKQSVYATCPHSQYTKPSLARTASVSGYECFYCGTGCDESTCTPGLQHFSVGVGLNCKCRDCTKCPAGQREVTPCQDAADTVCSADMCDGTINYCNQGRVLQCHAGEVGSRIYNTVQSRWGTIVQVKACTPSSDTVLGWCRDCAQPKVSTNLCTETVASILLSNTFNNFLELSNYWWIERTTVDVTGQVDGGKHCVDMSDGYYYSDRVAVPCPKGSYCTSSQLKVCPQFTYNLLTTQSSIASCLPCQVTSASPTCQAAGMYIITEMYSTVYESNINIITPPISSFLDGSVSRTTQPYPCGNRLNSVMFRINPYPACRECPIGFYCPLMLTPSNLAVIRTNLSAMVLRCSLCTPGLQSMNVVQGCDPRLPKQYLPPKCEPCPRGYDCSDPIVPVSCGPGTFADYKQMECTQCDLQSQCDVPGEYRPTGQCTLSNLWDEFGTSPFDQCAICESCAGGKPINTTIHDPQNAVCIPTSNLQNPCGVGCRTGFYIQTDQVTYGVDCHNCTKCSAGSIPTSANSCDGEKIADVQCMKAAAVLGKVEQTSCPQYEGVFMDMVTDGEYGNRTGTPILFDQAGSVTSTPDYLIYTSSRWCIYMFPFSSTNVVSTELKRIVGSKSGQSPQVRYACTDFSRASGTISATDLIIANQIATSSSKLSDSFVFGEISTLVYDHVSGSKHLFFLATSFRQINGENKYTSIINQHDAILAIDMDQCVGSVGMSKCAPMYVLDESIWASIYGASSVLSLNSMGPGRGISDIALVHSSTTTSNLNGMVKIAMMQEDKTLSILECGTSNSINNKMNCLLKNSWKIPYLYSTITGSVISPDVIIYAAIRTDQVVDDIDNPCIVDRINLQDGTVKHVVINACKPSSNDLIIDIQIIPSFPNWLWISRSTGIWAYDITDTDAFVTDIKIIDLDLLSPDAHIDTDPSRRNYNVTFPPTRTGIAVHLSTGFHWYPSCILCPGDRYQPWDGRTHPYCRPLVSSNQVPTRDRQNFVECDQDKEVAMMMTTPTCNESSSTCNNNNNPLFRVCFCKAGYMSRNPDGIGSCIPCSLGTYQPSVGMSSCLSCGGATTDHTSGGYTTVGPNSTSDTDCRFSGSVWYGTDFPLPRQCPPGTDRYHKDKPGYFHIRYDGYTWLSGGDPTLLSYKTVLFPNSIYQNADQETGYMASRTLPQIFPKGQQWFLQNVMNITLQRTYIPTDYERYNPYRLGMLCSCPMGMMSVYTSPTSTLPTSSTVSGILRCVSCPSGFYCPQNSTAFNMDPKEFIDSVNQMSGTTFPYPYPLSSIIQDGGGGYVKAGGAVLCPDWWYAITDSVSAYGVGAVSVEECATKQLIANSWSLILSYDGNGGDPCINVPNTEFNPSQLSSAVSAMDVCRCKRGTGLPSVISETVFVQTGCISCKQGYSSSSSTSSSSSSKPSPCYACTASNEYSKEKYAWEALGVIFCRKCTGENRIAQWISNTSTSSQFYQDADGKVNANTDCNCRQGFYTTWSSGKGVPICSMCPVGFYCPGLPKTPTMINPTIQSITYNHPDMVQPYDLEWRASVRCPNYDSIVMFSTQQQQGGPRYKFFTGVGRKSESECYTCAAGVQFDPIRKVCYLPSEVPCAMGRYDPPRCFECQPGHYCPNGVDMFQVQFGTIDFFGAISASQANPTVCPRNTYLVVQFSKDVCTPCPYDLVTNTTGARSLDECGCYPGYRRIDRQLVDNKCDRCYEGPEFCPGGNMPPVPCPGIDKMLSAPFGASMVEQCTCPRGTYDNISNPVCTNCPPGHSCAPSLLGGGGVSVPKRCPVDTYASPSSECVSCPGGGTTKGVEGVWDHMSGCFCKQQGYYYDFDVDNCLSCPPTSSFSITSVGGLFMDGINECKCTGMVGTYMNRTTKSCAPCPAGFACVSGVLSPCPQQSWSEERSTSCISTSLCPAGYFCGNSIKSICPAGYYCPSGITYPIVCISGGMSPPASTKGTDCGCPRDWFLVQPVNYNFTIPSSYCAQCGGYATTSDTKPALSHEECFCLSSHYGSPISPNYCKKCPGSLVTSPNRYKPNITTISDCVAQQGRYYVANDLSSYDCEPGYYCPFGSTSMTPCPTSSSSYWLAYDVTQCKCVAGTILNSGNCIQCPSTKGYCTEDAKEITLCTGDPNVETPLGSSSQEQCKNCKAGYYYSSDYYYYCMITPPGGTYSPAADGNLYKCSDLPNAVAIDNDIWGASSPEQVCKCDYNRGYIGSDPSSCYLCPAGMYCIGDNNVTLSSVSLFVCPIGYYCPAGTTYYPSSLSCADILHHPSATTLSNGSTDASQCVCSSTTPSTYLQLNTTTNVSVCIDCAPEYSKGYYCNNTKLVACPANSFCIDGVVYMCPVGSLSPPMSTDVLQCMCPPLSKWIGGRAECANCTEDGAICPGGDGGSTQESFCPSSSTNKGPVLNISQCICLKGWWVDYSNNKSSYFCQPCPSNKEYYCPSTWTLPRKCPAEGQVILPDSKHPSNNVSDCSCKLGYQLVDNSSSCTICPINFYCPTQNQKIRCLENLNQQQLVPGSYKGCNCSSGYFFSTFNNICTKCPKGYFCPSYVSYPMLCPYGTTTLNEGSYNVTSCQCTDGATGSYPDCAPCPSGSYCPTGSGLVLTCPVDNYCPPGSVSPSPCPATTTTVPYFQDAPSWGQTGEGMKSVFDCRCNYESGYIRSLNGTCTRCPGRTSSASSPPNAIWPYLFSGDPRVPVGGGTLACDCWCDQGYALNCTSARTETSACVACTGRGRTEGWLGDYTSCVTAGSELTSDTFAEPVCPKGFRCDSREGWQYSCNYWFRGYNPTPTNMYDLNDPAYSYFDTMVCDEGGGSIAFQSGVPIRENHGARQCGSGGKFGMSATKHDNDHVSNCQCRYPGEVPMACELSLYYDKDWFFKFCACPRMDIPLEYFSSRDWRLRVPRRYCYQNYVYVPDDSTNRDTSFKYSTSGGCEPCGHGLYCPKENPSTVNYYLTAYLTMVTGELSMGQLAYGFGQSVGKIVENVCEAPLRHVYCPKMPYAVEMKDCPLNSHQGYTISDRHQCYCNNGYHRNGIIDTDSGLVCQLCPAGSTCKNNVLTPTPCSSDYLCPYAGMPVPCPSNTFPINPLSVQPWVDDGRHGTIENYYCPKCSAGQYSHEDPPGKLTCLVCPVGYYCAVGRNTDQPLPLPTFVHNKYKNVAGLSSFECKRGYTISDSLQQGEQFWCCSVNAVPSSLGSSGSSSSGGSSNRVDLMSPCECSLGFSSLSLSSAAAVLSFNKANNVTTGQIFASTVCHP